MNKNAIKLALLTLCAVFFLSSQAQASLNYETAYMVKDNNSYDLSLNSHGNYSYNLGQLPWVYLKLRLNDLALDSPLHLHWVWSSDNDPNVSETRIEKFNITGLTGDQEIWKSAPQPWWNTEGGPGHWTVDTNWVNVNGTTNFSSANFNVTPEPVSSALFLLGGMPLATRLLRKKFKTA